MMTEPERENQEPNYTTAIQIVRMIRLLEHAPERTLSIQTIADELGVHPRTVKRYIAAVGEAIQVEDDAGRVEPLIARQKRGRSPVAVLSRADEHTPTTVELAAKAFAANLFGVVDPEGFGSYSDVTSDEVRRGGPMGRVMVDEAFVYVPFGPRAKQTRGSIFAPLMDAVMERRPTRISYLKVGAAEPQDYDVHPLCFLLYRDALYLHLEYFQEPHTRVRRSFMLDRIQKVVVDKDKHFIRPANLRVSSFFDSTVGIWRADGAKPVNVVIEFSEKVAHIIRERRWPGSGTVTDAVSPRSPNSVLLRMRVDITPELCAWVASFGKNAEALEPEAFREEMRNYLGDALDYYI